MRRVHFEPDMSCVEHVVWPARDFANFQRISSMQSFGLPFTHRLCINEPIGRATRNVQIREEQSRFDEDEVEMKEDNRRSARKMLQQAWTFLGGTSALR
jgi:hypothetical protein